MPSPSTDDTAVSATGLAAANNAFGLDLYGQFSDLPGNVFFSPHSIATALAMTHAGARHNTAVEMAAVLHLPEGDPHAASGALSESLQPRSDAYELRIANRLWAQHGLSLLDRFRTVTQQHYGAEVGLLDFKGASESARQTINSWVQDQTNDKIVDLLPQGSINSLTRLILTNAIYFKGTWLRQFDPAQTQDATFYGTSQTRTPLMYQRGSFRHSETADYQALRLPYEGDTLSMLVILPKSRDGLAAVEADLSLAEIESAVAAMRPAEIDVWLPRFKTSSHFSLRKTMMELGMIDAFTPSQADFSAMTGAKGLFVTDAIHKAFVEVNEEGSEAAAATAVVLGIESVRETISFRADHPFLFMIVDDRSESILFLGRLVDPSAGST